MPDSFKIDTHVHVFTTDMPLIDNPRHAPKCSFTHEDLIATLDSNGIDRAVVAAAGPWGDYNDYILAARCAPTPSGCAAPRSSNPRWTASHWRR